MLDLLDRLLYIRMEATAIETVRKSGVSAAASTCKTISCSDEGAGTGHGLTIDRRLVAARSAASHFVIERGEGFDPVAVRRAQRDPRPGPGKLKAERWNVTLSARRSRSEGTEQFSPGRKSDFSP